MSKSRYFTTKIVDGKSYETWDFPKSLRGVAPIDLLAGLQTHDHVFALGDRVDKLANRYLGDDQYWWVITLVNGINFPLGIAPGTVLKIPADVVPVLDKLGMI